MGRQPEHAHHRRRHHVDARYAGVALDSAKFDLALSVRDEGDTLHVSLHYRADLFEDATAQSLLARYAALLDAIAADPMSPTVMSSRAAGEGPALDSAPTGDEYSPPEGPVEEVIAGVWSEMLGRTKDRSATASSSTSVDTHCSRRASWRA